MEVLGLDQVSNPTGVPRLSIGRDGRPLESSSVPRRGMEYDRVLSRIHEAFRRLLLDPAEVNDYEGGNDHEGGADLAVPDKVDGW